MRTTVVASLLLAVVPLSLVLVFVARLMGALVGVTA